MCDDLIEELNSVLKVDKDKLDKSNNRSNKLQSYFGDDSDKDDLFDNMIYRNFDKNHSENVFSSQLFEKTPKDYKKLVRFSENFDLEIQSSKPIYNLSNDEYPGSAWLNSENTKNILAKIISKDINCSQINKTLLARPQLHTDSNQKLVDPIFSLLAENISYNVAMEMRQVPSTDDIIPTEKEVLYLIEKGWIRPAIDLTSKILNKMGYTYAQESLIDSSSFQFTIEAGRLWCLRFTLLARLKLISILELELSGFQNLDCPNLYKEFYSDSYSVYNKGSLIPFSMRLIYAELPLFSNKYGEALNRLYYMLAVIKRIIVNIENGYSEDGTNLCTDQSVGNNALRIWQKRRIRVLVSCMRVLISSKDYPSIIDVIHDLIRKTNNDMLTCFSKDNLYHLLGRVYLQLGNIETAEFYFEQSLQIFKETIEKELQGNGKNIYNDIIKTKLFFQNGLLNISRSNFEEAKRCFQYCLEANMNSSLILNNYAVCCLYLKQVQEAISILEKLLHSGIHYDGLIFNLCFLYELQTNQVKNKKLKIIKLLASFPGDDYNVASFKLGSSD